VGAGYRNENQTEPLCSDMTEPKKTPIAGLCFPGALLFALVWVCVSFCITIMLAKAEDPPRISMTVPSSLKIAYAITLFPVRQLLPWEWTLDHLGRQNATMIEIFGMFVNGLFWSFLVIFLYRLGKWVTH
jgi:hypothetical protein